MSSYEGCYILFIFFIMSHAEEGANGNFGGVRRQGKIIFYMWRKGQWEFRWCMKMGYNNIMMYVEEETNGNSGGV